MFANREPMPQVQCPPEMCSEPLQTGSDRVLRKRWILLLGWQDCVFSIMATGRRPALPAASGLTEPWVNWTRRGVLRSAARTRRLAELSVHPTPLHKRGLHQDCRAVCNAPALIESVGRTERVPHLRVMSISQSPTIPNPYQGILFQDLNYACQHDGT